MTIASALTDLNTDIQNARTVITNKGGTVTVDGGSSQLATDIGTITELKGETRSVSINNVNGNTFTPSTGKNGITSITVTPKNYARTINPTTSQQTFNVPSGYSGHGQIKVNAYPQPTGTLSITQNGTYDVTNYASADVNVSGGGGGGGFNLEYLYNHNGGQHLNLTLNSTNTFPLFTDGWAQFNAYSRVIIPSVSKFIVNSTDSYYWGDCIIELTVGGTTRALSPGETVTLTQDSKLKIYEADCLLKGTAITMADGSIKEISQVKVGDMVMCINEQGLIDEDTVTFSDGDTKKYNDNYDLWEFENNYEVRTTHHHRFYNVERQAMVYLDEFKIREHTIDKDGNQLSLLKRTNMEKEVHHFTIATKNWNNYFANGMLCGNRLSTEIHLGTEEQKQVQSTPSESIGEFLEH